MYIEHEQYPKDPVALAEALKVNYDIEYILVGMKFTISPYRPATFYDPAEGGELEIEETNILALTTGDDIEVKLTKDMKFTIGAFLDDEELEEACWQEWKADQEQSEQDRAEYLYETRNDR